MGPCCSVVLFKTNSGIFSYVNLKLRNLHAMAEGISAKLFMACLSHHWGLKVSVIKFARLSLAEGRMWSSRRLQRINMFLRNPCLATQMTGKRCAVSEY